MEYELEHLEKIKEIANKRIAVLEVDVDWSESEIIASQVGMGDEVSHSISGSLYGSESFEQLVELSQMATQISDEMDKHEIKMDELEQLKRLVLSPYFARIDFTFPGKDAPSEIYIGRTSLMEELEILIHDWRSPIAGLFYQYGLGQGSYEAPVGTITGDITLKRQYEIKDGKLEYFFDTNMEIVDEYLRSLLSKNASSQMKGIVETIQKEQDTAIRDDKNKVLIVQGVAGSGKTSVALHRIAYLMYKGLVDRLDSHEIVIISPNNLFEQYISNVLPELGEKNVRSFVPEELLGDILGRSNIQSRAQIMEQLMIGENRWNSVTKSSLEFKCSRNFVRILSKLRVATGDYKDIRSVYGRLFEEHNRLKNIAEKYKIDLPDDIDEIIEFTKENLGSRKLFFDDASALTFLYLRNTEVDRYENIKQVVVDEAQDYYDIHFQIFNLLFPKAKFTILGDVNQTIDKPENIDFYENIFDVIHREPGELITLEKSFRCTNEIIDFSSRILNIDIQSFGRNGSEPSIIHLDGNDNLDQFVNDTKECLASGYKSIGIICKSMRECKKLYKKLKHQLDVTLFDDSTREEIKGIFILPIYLSKGLEFDVAFVWDVSDKTYNSENDRALLFIACTRAMHKLRLYYGGDVSHLL